MTALAIVLIVIGLAGSAFISAAEAGLISVNKLRVRHLAEKGDKRAAAVVRIVDEHEKFFGTILFLNSVQRVPKIGDRLRYQNLRFRITAMSGLKIARVRVRRRVPSAEPVPA